MHNTNLHVRRVKTIKVKADSELGYMIINESDFDPKKHKEFVEKKAPVVKKAEKEE